MSNSARVIGARCPYCNEIRLRVDTKIFSYSEDDATANVVIICDNCHKTIFEREFEE